MKKFLILTIFFAGLSYIFSEFSEYFVNTLAGRNIGKDNPISNDSISTKIILGLILSPIVETYLFQQSVLIFTRKLFDSFPYNYIIPIAFSSLLFGIMHSFSIYYIIDGVIIGSWFAFVYLFTLDKFKTKIKAFGTTWFCHLLLNSIAILA